MSIAASEGILKGRPFDGVAFLWYKSLNRCFKFVQSDPNGRCLLFTLKCDHKSILIFNLYFPCYEASAEYRAEIAFYVGFIENVLSTVTFSDVIIMGDMNFEVSNSNSGYDLFKSLLSSYSIVDCDEFIVGRNRHTYVNEALGHVVYRPLLRHT